MVGDRACPHCGCRCEADECVCDLTPCEDCEPLECLRGGS